MNKSLRIAIVFALVALVAFVMVTKKRNGTQTATIGGVAESAVAIASQSASASTSLPRLVDLGAGKCIPCKQMAPILEELKKEFAGRLDVAFIDVWKNPNAGDLYQVRMIPTQIFYDAVGKERFRHEGFFSRDDILGKWKELGVDLQAKPAAYTTSKNALFATLTHAVEGAPLIALVASFIWGILSILLSPCHLASIPLIVGFIDQQGQITMRRAFVISTLFAVGILITIALIGAITATAGRMMGDVGCYGNYFVATIFFLVGLVLLDVISMPLSGPSQVQMKRKGALAAFILGLVFGIALGPCTFAYMAPMLGVTFKLASTSALYGVLLLLVYGVGHCSVIVAAGTSTELVQKYLNWNEQSKGAVILKKICGALVLLGGVYLLYTAY